MNRPTNLHIGRVEDPVLHADDDIKDVLKARVAPELQAMERWSSTLATMRDNAGEPTKRASMASLLR
ncbi:MAG: hypothetical protein AB1773_11455 [Pseudomonadota bacterium]